MQVHFLDQLFASPFPSCRIYEQTLIRAEGKQFYGCYLIILLGTRNSEFGKDNFYADNVTFIVIVMVSLFANLLIKPELLFFSL